jgi:hypothetical protein
VESKKGILACRPKQYFHYRTDYNLNFNFYLHLTNMLFNYASNSLVCLWLRVVR